ncbi:MAG: rhomboid family intramembrane serine protease [candidate division Zixibacteria bacterium]|nr:rhomboid family intramembrane serine protease [candidate division Zixibacteria bacterium]
MFIPIRDNLPTLRTPFVTVTLIVINTLVFILSWLTGQANFEGITMTYGFTPDFVLDLHDRYTTPSWIYLTPFTSMFMHGGWMHLIGNMLFLWIYGNNIEDFFGSVRFLLFYLLSGIAAIALYSALNLDSQVPLVGASGAIAGVMGAYMLLHPKAEITVLMFFFFIQFITIPARVLLGFWIGYQLLMSALGAAGGGGIAWLAHVGGFVFGYLVLLLYRKARGAGSTPTSGPRVYRMQW